MLDAGYRSTSRFYEGAARRIGMSPTTYRRGGASAMVRYLVIDSTLGRLLVAGTAKGICAVSLGDSDGTLTRALKQEYPTACLESANPELVAWARELLARLDGRQPSRELPVDVQATAFQQQVWKALKDIPFGETRTYSQLARAIGSPRAVRAVGRACATTPVAVVVPCHRVVPAAGGVGGYRWGTDRKRKLLAREGTILDRD
jgi:AraC family transcriptional regulator of adaptative response/methylated-DNA-[protein]-cysteine methyltransferase